MSCCLQVTKSLFVLFAYFFPKVTLPQRIVVAFGKVCTDNYVMGNVPYRRVVVKLAVVPARGMACSSFMQERKGSTLGLGATRVPDGQAGAAIREEEAVPQWWSLLGAHPGSATPGHLQTHTDMIFPCVRKPEIALGGTAVNIVLLSSLFFFLPSSFQTNT